MTSRIHRCFLSFLVLSLTMSGADADVVINFDELPNGTDISIQYSTFGAVFSSNGGSAFATSSDEASSSPNYLRGNPNTFQPIQMDLSTPVIEVQVTLISVGDNEVTVTAFASDFATVLDFVTVENNNTGTNGDGYGNKDTVTLTGAGIARVTWEITEATISLLDGFAIDDIHLTAVPEPSSLVLCGLAIAGLCAIQKWRAAGV